MQSELTVYVTQNYIIHGSGGKVNKTKTVSSLGIIPACHKYSPDTNALKNTRVHNQEGLSDSDPHNALAFLDNLLEILGFVFFLHALQRYFWIIYNGMFAMRFQGNWERHSSDTEWSKKPD